MDAEVSYQIFVSDLAAEQIKSHLSSRGTPKAYLRLGVTGSGCNGYSYLLQFEDAAPSSKDLVFEEKKVQLVVDKKSIIYLNGCTLGWEKSLLKTGYVISNPQEKSRCGCGHSFSV
jgi:iron-sulfur cluster assembly protein